MRQHARSRMLDAHVESLRACRMSARSAASHQCNPRAPACVLDVRAKRRFAPMQILCACGRAECPREAPQRPGPNAKIFHVAPNFNANFVRLRAC